MLSSRGSSQTQGSNPSLLCLLHWQASPLPLVPPGKPCDEDNYPHKAQTEEENLEMTVRETIIAGFEDRGGTEPRDEGSL